MKVGALPGEAFAQALLNPLSTAFPSDWLCSESCHISLVQPTRLVFPNPVKVGHIFPT